MTHKCEYSQGRIKDVTIRRNSKTIHCRRCGKQLDDSEVDEIVLKKVKEMFR